MIEPFEHKETHFFAHFHQYLPLYFRKIAFGEKGYGAKKCAPPPPPGDKTPPGTGLRGVEADYLKVQLQNCCWEWKWNHSRIEENEKALKRGI